MNATTQQQVNTMLATPGLYVLIHPQRPGEMVPIVSQGGKLFSMKIDAELRPDGFNDGWHLKGYQ